LTCQPWAFRGFEAVIAAMLVVAGVGSRHPAAGGATRSPTSPRRNEDRRKAIPAPREGLHEQRPHSGGRRDRRRAQSRPRSLPKRARPPTTTRTRRTKRAAKDKGSAKDKERREGPGVLERPAEGAAGQARARHEFRRRDADPHQRAVDPISSTATDPAQRAVIARDRQNALDELTASRKDILYDKKAIADLQEEARRSGVPPGLAAVSPRHPPAGRSPHPHR